MGTLKVRPKAVVIKIHIEWGDIERNLSAAPVLGKRRLPNPFLILLTMIVETLITLILEIIQIIIMILSALGVRMMILPGDLRLARNSAPSNDRPKSYVERYERVSC